MPILEIAAKFTTYAVMAVILVFALGVVTLRNLFHCALCLAAALIGTAVLYVVLQAEYLAAIQILLYVGAVVTLVIFAIMLTEHLAGKTVRQNNSQSLPAIAGLLGLSAAHLRPVVNSAPGVRAARPVDAQLRVDRLRALGGPVPRGFSAVLPELLRARLAREQPVTA